MANASNDYLKRK